RTCASSSSIRCFSVRSSPASSPLRAATAALLTRTLIRLPSQGVDLFFESDHLQLTPDNDLLKLLEVEDLLLQLRLRLLEIADDLVVGAHVTQDPERPDDFSLGVTQRRRIEAGRNNLPGGCPWAERDVSDHAFLYHFAKRSRELTRLLLADKLRDRLFHHFVGAEAEQLRHG